MNKKKKTLLLSLSKKKSLGLVGSTAEAQDDTEEGTHIFLTIKKVLSLICPPKYMPDS